MFKTLCVTHPGDAHLDDFLSACVFFALGGGRVERREPTSHELTDPEVVVLDVGGLHDPAMTNFDHHQFPRDAEAECALSLYVREMHWAGASVLEAFSDQPWFDTLRVMDSKGPSQLATKLGTTTDVVFALLSPVERILVDRFGQLAEVVHSGNLGQMMTEIGNCLLNDAAIQLRRVKALNDECELVEVHGVSGYVLHSSDTTGTGTWRKRFAPGTAFSVVHDNRGPGWALYRYDDDKRINFSQLAGNELVAFCHRGGFMTKTLTRDKVSLGAALHLVGEAVVGQ
jgi:hypothetical protein